MGEGIHSPVATKPGNKRKWTFIIAGTAVVLLATGVLVQVLRPAPAFPGEGQDPASNEQSGERRQDKFLAKVGNKYIRYDDVANEVMERHGAAVLDNLINRTIIKNACDDRGIVVTKAEVEQEIVTIAKNFQLAPDVWLQMLQAERDIKPDQYRRDIIWPMIALRKLAGETVEVTEEEMQKAFERNYGPKVKVRAIVLNNSRRAGEVWERVRKAAEEGGKLTSDDFGKLARQCSDDPNSRPLDGVVPPIRRHGDVETKTLEDAAFKMKAGEYSGVVQVGLKQWVILFCEGYTEQIVKDLTEVRDVLMADLRQEKQQKSVAKLFSSLKEATRVDNYLKGTAEGGQKNRGIRTVGGTSSPLNRRVRTASAGQEEGATPIPSPRPRTRAAQRPAEEPLDQ